MRVLTLAFLFLVILVGADAAKAGPSTIVRDQLASVDPATLAAATQETEDQIRLDKAKRRYVQRGLTRLGFDSKVNGKFDEPTRAAISRWQIARGYPETGFLSPVQHTALQAEIVSAAQASVDSRPEQTTRGRGTDSARQHRGGPGGLIGGVVGGMFR
ncbi:peptidoglycan-binding domain-containing protein [Bradyrhizobium sp.]|uniref:peptidoglycan-binding domain-containing protein n=1 Tax=Bradyrhizobium sp. TaxID=376 RepID=UPI001D3813B0|nr:peptidoglycan-binding domain-containing protein [Bradyrhizobium sp.]MBI5323398.1 peptidoglycan-binding protein [Bradyrhizobium sp.]